MTVKLVRVPDMGVGRLIEERPDGTAIVEFVPTPGSLPRQLLVSHFEFTELQTGDRVWISPDPGEARWLTGRLAAPRHDDKPTYLVDLPNYSGAAVHEERIWARWDLPIEDPMEMLINHVGESPHLFLNRLQALSAVTTQRSNIASLSGIWSSVVELHEHQVEAARRILMDPIKRYLLADEVGLGKTIETGFVIRQTLLQDRSASVLVLAPDHLVAQWSHELETKFHLSDFGSARVSVKPHSDLVRVHDTFTLCVIDEVHRLITHPSHATNEQRHIFDKIRSIALGTPSLLLLTATPVRAGDIDYLAILHLLSPETHPLAAIDEFRQKLAMRNTIAEIMMGLTPDVGHEFVPFIVGDLAALIPNDQDLQQLLDNLRTVAEEGADLGPLIDQVRSRISERYRLHNRMIRNRRHGKILRQFPVRGRTVEHRHIFSCQSSRLDDELQRIRETLREVDLESAVVARLMTSCLYLVCTGTWVSPEDRIETVAFLGAGPVESLEMVAAANEILRTRVSEVAGVVKSMRTKRGGSDTRKKAVFATSVEFADELENEFAKQWGQNKVFRLTSDSPSSVIADFNSAPGQALLICDRSVEEGVNLQFVDVAILADLPFSTQQFEQRIGRFDRFSQDFRPIELFLVVSDSQVEQTWLTHVEATGVLKNSVASLQYALSDFEITIFSTWALHGHDKAREICLTTTDFVAKEVREVEKQDILDSGNFGSRSDTSYFESLSQESRFAATFETAISRYAADLGLRFDSFENGVKKLRAEYKSKHLISPRRAFRFHPDQWRHPGSFHREIAVDNEGCRFYGLGNPLIDAIGDAILSDDRGQVSARRLIKRELGRGMAVPIFDLHFIIETNIPIEIVPDDMPLDVVRSMQASIDHSCPRVLVSRVLAANLTQPPSSIVSLINSPYSKSFADINLCGSGYELFIELTKPFAWKELCRAVEQEAMKSVRDTELQDVVDKQKSRLSTMLTRTRNLLETRVDAGMDIRESLRDHDHATSILLSAGSTPTVRLDSVKVTFLGGSGQ